MKSEVSIGGLSCSDMGEKPMSELLSAAKAVIDNWDKHWPLDQLLNDLKSAVERTESRQPVRLSDEEYKTVKPRIVCSANKYLIEYSPNEIEELVIAGARHWDSVMRGIWDALDDYTIVCIMSEEQGFIDQFGLFYTRKEAYIIAKENGQIIRDLGYETDELFSEHLY